MKTKIILLTIAILTLACNYSAATQTASTVGAPKTAPIVEEVATAPNANTQTWTVCTNTLRVRGCPATTCSEIRYLKQGDTVTVREWSHNGNGWAMIAAAEWVNGDYLCHP